MRKSKISFRKVFFLATLFYFVYGFLSPTLAQQANERAKVLRQEADKIFKNIEVFDVNEFTGVPRSVRGKLGSNIDLDKDDQIVEFLKNSDNVFLINQNTDGFKVKKKFSDNLYLKHAKVQQTFKGIPVWGSELIVHSDKINTVIEVNGRFTPNIALDVIPSISSSNALQIALSDLGPSEYRWKNPEQEKILKEVYKDGTLSWEPKPELVIAPKGGDFDKGEYRLAWKMRIAVDGAKLGNYEYFIDAVTGEVINKYNSMADVTGSGVSNYNGTVQFSTNMISANNYQLYDTDRYLKTYTANGQTINPGTLLTDTDNYWDQNKSAVDAHWGAMKVYDFYKNVFNRNSFNDAGAEIISTTQYLFYLGRDNDNKPVFSPNNAAWDGAQMLYGAGDGSQFSSVTSLDVCGHEITHAVTTSTANLATQGESGALNEGLSDILGAAIEFYSTPAKANWLIGEECYTPGTSGDALRYMNNPNLGNQPDTYNGTNWASTSNPSKDNDQGGVHTNSGVLNYAFYLMCVGGSGTNDLGTSFNVTGITIEKARAIAYKALTTYLISSSNYADARNAFLSAAAALYGSGSQEHKTVSDAFGAVGIGIRFTAENSFGAGTIKINGITTPSGSNFFATAGSNQTLEAIPQYSNPYNYVWNTSGSENSISNWKKRLPGGSIIKLFEATNISYNFNASNVDLGATFIADLKKICNITRNDVTEFDGNISAGVVTSIVEQNSVTVPAPYQQTINGKVYTYGGWSDGGDGTVMPTAHMTANALYKVLNNSNCSGAFTNNSQKKLTDIYGGGAYKVYESMNRIWLESSYDNGKTWTLTPYNPISGTAVAHSPAIDIPAGPYPYEYIVYSTSDASGSKVMLTINFENLFRSTIDVSGNLPFSNYDFQPVIAIKENYTDSKIIVVWHQPYMDYFDPAGFYYRVGTINPDHTVTWNNSRYMDYTENCSNPAVVASKTLTDPNQFHLAYQEDMGYGDSRVSYLRLDLNSDNTISYSNGYEVSQGSGYYVNTNPSITLSGGLPKVSWIGYDRVVTYMQDALFRSKDGSFSWGSVYTYVASGNNTVSVSLDKVGTSGYLLGYGDEYGDIRYVKSTSPSTVRFADNTGSYVQVKGGTDFSSSFIESFRNESLPYYFTSSSAVSVLGKTNTETISGRGLNITKDGLGFSFNLKDVRLDGNQVDFTEESDSALSQRNIIETKAFSVGDNSELTYSYSYFTSDSAKVLMSLKDGEVVNYSLDLVDATSKEVLKNLASVSYSNKDVNKKRPECYKLLLKGIGNRTVKLRISSDVNLIDNSGILSTIAKIYSTGSSLKKNGFIEEKYSDMKPVVEYGLSQNYPNPFNPTTVINYQIPKASKVSLKIYDMLGREVTTFVNGYKEMGSYSVEFNASSLPSGTYIYEIRANDFVKSGKMILLK